MIFRDDLVGTQEESRASPESGDAPTRVKLRGQE